MASPSSNMACLFHLLFLISALLSACSSATGEGGRSHHKVELLSLLPSKLCSSARGSAIANATRLRVVHRHGPCSPLHGPAALFPEQILDNDRTRVASLLRRISGASKLHYSPARSSEIAVHSGTALSLGDYVVSVGFGSPKTDQTLIFDTGSDVTWVQCSPCVSYCHRQVDPLFDPASSSTYANISCSSTYCDELDTSGCSGSTCLYGVAYGDDSQTVGFYAQDTLTLTPTDVIPKFRFGCGQDNEGLFGRVAGLLGLGRDKPSLVSQTYAKYGGVFAYCLPSSSSSDGYLSFGGKYSSTDIKFTPMLKRAATPTFYYINLIGISVAGQRLPVSASVFKKPGMLIDSGTVISRLPPAAYSALRAAYRRAMAGYKTAAPLSILDTCYDFTGRSEVVVPTVAVQFDGGMTVDLDASGIVYVANQSQVCLAFAANDDDSSQVGILGNVQQRTFEVVYDVSKKLIGFGRGGC